jgi:hypothetical protein
MIQHKFFFQHVISFLNFIIRVLEAKKNGLALFQNIWSRYEGCWIGPAQIKLACPSLELFANPIFTHKSEFTG